MNMDTYKTNTRTQHIQNKYTHITHEHGHIQNKHAHNTYKTNTHTSHMNMDTYKTNTHNTHEHGHIQNKHTQHTHEHGHIQNKHTHTHHMNMDTLTHEHTHQILAENRGGKCKLLVNTDEGLPILLELPSESNSQFVKQLSTCLSMYGK